MSLESTNSIWSANSPSSMCKLTDCAFCNKYIDNAKLKHDLIERSKEIVSIKKVNNDLIEDSQILRDNNEMLTEKIETLNAEIDDCDDYICELEEELDELYEELDEVGLDSTCEVKSIHFCDLPNKAKTVVLFTDGTKSIVNCSTNDTFDLNVGVALCLAEKLFGGKTQYHKFVKKLAGIKDEKKHKAEDKSVTTKTTSTKTAANKKIASKKK